MQIDHIDILVFAIVIGSLAVAAVAGACVIRQVIAWRRSSVVHVWRDTPPKYPLCMVPPAHINSRTWTATPRKEAKYTRKRQRKPAFKRIVNPLANPETRTYRQWRFDRGN